MIVYYIENLIIYDHLDYLPQVTSYLVLNESLLLPIKTQFTLLLMVELSPSVTY